MPLDYNEDWDDFQDIPNMAGVQACDFYHLPAP
jgi:hypothetical protein